MTSMNKKLLIVQSTAPFGTSAIQESLDLVLAAGTFDQDINLLIEDDACYQLIKNQQPEKIDRKNTTKMLTALPIYGIEKILICSQSIKARGLTIPTKNSQYILLDPNEIKRIYNESDTVIRF